LPPPQLPNFLQRIDVPARSSSEVVAQALTQHLPNTDPDPAKENTMNTAKIIAASSAIAMTTVLFSGVANLADHVYSPNAVMAAAAARDASVAAIAANKPAIAAATAA
jgi:hypothetical protein